ncbi:MAG: precorrin-4 C(11)-methyltransferase, partial [Rhodobacteraceae bacterium]|nr:precorrin-4 C(11)-methyltransferase [Paracoccaceae bacterium]
PVIVAYRASWPDAIYLKGTLGDIRIKVKKEKITRTALIMVGPAMADIRDFRDSALYDPQIPHLLRPKVN